MKDFTIVRRRVVVQISTDQVRAETEEEALNLINDDKEGNADTNEWQDLDDVIDYPDMTSDDVLEAIEVDDEF
jgi:hypothetical protein